MTADHQPFSSAQSFRSPTVYLPIERRLDVLVLLRKRTPVLIQDDLFIIVEDARRSAMWERAAFAVVAVSAVSAIVVAFWS